MVVDPLWNDLPIIVIIIDIENSLTISPFKKNQKIKEYPFSGKPFTLT